MADLSAHPRHDRGTGAGEEPHREPTRGRSRWQKVVGVGGLAVVLWVGGDLYDIVTSGGDDPPRDAPPGEVTGNGDPAPPGAEPHGPPSGGH